MPKKEARSPIFQNTLAIFPDLAAAHEYARCRPIGTGSPLCPDPDTAGQYTLKSWEDPSYETVAALGAEYMVGLWSRMRRGGRRHHSILSRMENLVSLRTVTAPGNLTRREAASTRLPFFHRTTRSLTNIGMAHKRTLLGGYLPVADVGVWNPQYDCGYEAMVLLPSGADAKPIGRVRSIADGRVSLDRYWNCSPHTFYAELARIWNRWSSLYETSMRVDIPDEWILNAARAGITLSRCSYRGLEPTYQIGEGAYTKIPERSHVLFPVAQYEFVWAQSFWNLTDDADVYFQYHLDKYIQPNGDFLYNTQDQVEAPLNVGVFLANSARSFDYNRNIENLRKRLPVLERMIAFARGALRV